MGEILKDIKSGKCCDICGIYYENDIGAYIHGYPATCWDCWDELPEDEKLFHRKAEVPPPLPESRLLC